MQPLFLWDEFKTKQPPPVVSLGFKVDLAAFLMPELLGGLNINLGHGDNTAVPCHCLWRHHVMLFSIALKIQILKVARQVKH